MNALRTTALALACLALISQLPAAFGPPGGDPPHPRVPSNLPPIAVASASATAARLGDQVTFGGRASYDVDGYAFQHRELPSNGTYSIAPAIVPLDEGGVAIAWDAHENIWTDEAKVLLGILQPGHETTVTLSESGWMPTITAGTELYVAWQDFSGPFAAVDFAVVAVDGQILVGPLRLSNASSYAGRPSLSQDETGGLHVVWTEAANDGVWRIQYAFSEDRGRTFTPPLEVDSGSRRWHLFPSVSAMSGRVHVAWTEQFDPGDWRLEYSLGSHEAGFSPAIRVDRADDLSADPVWGPPTIAAEPSGTVYVGWSCCAPQSNALAYRKAENQTRFSPPIMLNDGTSSVAYPRFVIDDRRLLHAVWVGGVFGASGVYLATLLPDTGIVTRSTVVWEDTATTWGFAPAIAARADGNLTVAWEGHSPDNNQSRVWYGEGNATTNLQMDWDFGDGTSASGQVAAHAFATPGTYQVVLTVTDLSGATAQDTVAVNVSGDQPSSAELILRIAGKKGHRVTASLTCDNRLVANVTVIRRPGDPDIQQAEIGRVTKGENCSVIVGYAPTEGGSGTHPSGSTPAWLVLRQGGNDATFHHVFNDRHPTSWVWRIDDLSGFVR